MAHTKSRTNKTAYAIIAVVIGRAVARHLHVDLDLYGLGVDELSSLLELGLGALVVYFRTNIRTDIGAKS